VCSSDLVMLFSDNVPLEEEINLKRFARRRGLLLMGPDCGTAIINGVPLAFANVVSRGDIGIVAAAGTGAQAVSCMISNEGAGVSQVIGTGGRDVKKEVGGLMFLEGLEALSADSGTHVMVLIAKTPHASVLSKIGKSIKRVRKPVVAAFLGAEEKSVIRRGMIPAANLEEAALTAVALSQGRDRSSALASLAERDRGINRDADRAARQVAKDQKYIRGLFSGGTFCAEAQLLFRMAEIRNVNSNVPMPPFALLEDARKSKGHTLVDLGEDEFTVGRPHPMIDDSLRNRRIHDEAGDPETAAILIDVVLGYGSNMDPVQELAPVIRAARLLAARAKRHLIFACSVTGTEQDPQDRARTLKELEAAGARVFASNTAACKFAARLAQCLEGK
jgi:FdrA protein